MHSRESIVIAIALGLAASMAKATTYDDVLQAIRKVESGANPKVKDGDGGKAIGEFQIHKAYWQDAVNHDKTIGGRYEDCRKYDYALKIVKAYMDRYAREFIQKKDWEKVARIHNGGLMGYKNSATLKYWALVKKHLKE